MTWWHRPLFAVIAVLAGFLAAGAAPGADSEPVERQVFIEICVAELSIEKLKSLGIDWEVLVKRIAPAEKDSAPLENRPVDAIKFVRALGELNQVEFLANPRLATMSGQSASLAVGDREAGDEIQLEVVPEVTEQKKIKLKYDLRISRLLPIDEKIAVAPPLAVPRGKRIVAQSTSIELTPGQTAYVANPPRLQTDKQGTQQEVTTVVFLRADFQPPADIRMAEKRSAPQTVPPGRYRDVEVAPRR